jgi:8-oxo-dGTP pyrophosphatase MutT (NUDIX family)
VISINGENGRFSLRIAGILIHNNKILLQRAIKTGAWVLPGGRGEINETSEETLIREIKEELGVDINIKRLVWIIENFDAYGAEGLHELGFYYLGQLSSNCDLLDIQGDFEGNENSIKLIFQWFEIDEISKLEIYPLFLRDHLTKIPESFQHIITKDLLRAITS